MNINTVKNYIDRIQINIRLVLFYSLIYDRVTQNYTHLLIQIDISIIDLYLINVIFYSIKLFDKVYNINDLNH